MSASENPINAKHETIQAARRRDKQQEDMKLYPLKVPAIGCSDSCRDFPNNFYYAKVFAGRGILKTIHEGGTRKTKYSPIVGTCSIMGAITMTGSQVTKMESGTRVVDVRQLRVGIQGYASKQLPHRRRRHR